MSAAEMITQRDLIKEPQSVTEGSTVSTYGTTPANPAFTIHGQDAALSDESTPTVAELRNAGNIDRIKTTKVMEENLVKLTMKVLATDKVFLQSLINSPDGTNTSPDASHTFFHSYRNDQGVETFVQFRGCKISEVALSYDGDNYLTLEATYSYKTKITNTTGPVIGSGSYGTANTGTPLIHLDAAASPFTLNNTVTSIESFSISVSYSSASQKALGSVVPLYMRPTQRTVSGSSVIYKKDENLQNAARAVTEATASYIMDSGNIVLTFTNFKLLTSAEELKGDDAEATKENKSWEASSVNIAT